jgi:translation elongation factor EF-Ts
MQQPAWVNKLWLAPSCRAKIVEGRVAKTLKTTALLEQPFIKDGDRSVATVIKEAVATLGENIQVRRFERCAAAAAAPSRAPPWP